MPISGKIALQIQRPATAFPDARFGISFGSRGFGFAHRRIGRHDTGGCLTRIAIIALRALRALVSRAMNSAILAVSKPSQ
jgi:hypothetical protein